MENKSGTAAKQVKENVPNASDSTENFKGKVVQKIEETKDKFSENLSLAADKFHEKSDSAQGFFDSRTENINQYAHQAIDKANQLGHRAADALSSSSDYVSNFDFDKTKHQIVKTIKEKPQFGLAIAGLFGLLIGLLLGRKNSK